MTDEIDPLNFTAARIIANVSGNLSTDAGRRSALSFAHDYDNELNAMPEAQRRFLWFPLRELNTFVMRACAPHLPNDRRAQWLAVVAVMTLVVRELIADDTEALRQARANSAVCA